MSGDMPMWKGLFEWSMNYQDGTNEGARPRELTEEDRHWLENALKTAMVDLGNRMKDIKESLDASGSETQPSDEIPGSRLSTPSLQEKEQLLDELLDLVESIDQAKDLSTIGGLQTLLTLLQGGTSPSLQWRAAEIIATCVQNNPSVQEIFLRDGCMSAIWPLLDHDNVTCQIKALLAMSCMIRGCPAALQWFREQRGISKTVDLLSNTEDIRIQRKCLHILEYALRAVPADCMNAVSDRSPLLSALTSLILRRDDADVRTAALAVGKQLAEDKYALKLMKQDDAFVQAVQEAQCRLDLVSKEDWGPVEDEAKLAISLGAALAGNVSKESSPPAMTSSQPPGTLQIMAIPKE